MGRLPRQVCGLRVSGRVARRWSRASPSAAGKNAQATPIASDPQPVTRHSRAAPSARPFTQPKTALGSETRGRSDQCKSSSGGLFRGAAMLVPERRHPRGDLRQLHASDGLRHQSHRQQCQFNRNDFAARVIWSRVRPSVSGVNAMVSTCAPFVICKRVLSPSHLVAGMASPARNG